MSELLKINVNEHVEKKNGLSYLSWAWAWAEVLKLDPVAEWMPMYFGPASNPLPYMSLPDGSMMVGVEVLLLGKRRVSMLPVMDHRNKAIKNPDAFAVNTALMRCLAKAIAMHGLGLYIYAGEDLPEGEEPPKTGGIADDLSVSPTAEAWKMMDEDSKTFLRKIAAQVTRLMPDAVKAIDVIEFADLDADRKAALWSLFDAPTRSALKKAKEAA